MKSRQQQKGAVLVVGMILLLVVTLLSVNMMSVNSLEMKIADNSTQKAVSFEAAESARNSAKQTADSIAASLNSNPTVFPSAPNGVYNVGGPGTTVTAPAVDTETFWASSSNYAVSASNSKYVVEYLGKRDMELDSNRNTGTTSNLHVFRLTMRGNSAVNGVTAIQAVYVTN